MYACLHRFQVKEVPIDGDNAEGYSVGSLDKPTARLSQYARGKTGNMNPFTPGGEVSPSVHIYIYRNALKYSTQKKEHIKTYRIINTSKCMKYSTLLYYNLLYFTLLCSALLYSTTLYPLLYPLLYSTLTCSTLLHSTLLYSTLLYSTLL